MRILRSTCIDRLSQRVKALWVGNPSLCLQPDVAGETAVYRVSTFGN